MNRVNLIIASAFLWMYGIILVIYSSSDDLSFIFLILALSIQFVILETYMTRKNK